MFRFFSLLVAMTMLVSCGEAVRKGETARILAMGDSMLAWHGGTGHSISDSVEHILGEPVIDRSVVGARMIYKLPISGSMGLNISKQYQPGAWKWVILNGGGNDLWFGCGCTRCDRKMGRLISSDGSAGTVVDMVSGLRATGARVIYLGYLRSPGVRSWIDHCRDEGNEFERRLALMAARDSGVHFISLADLVPHGDRSYHAADMIHPSVKASRAIAARIAAVIR